MHPADKSAAVSAAAGQATAHRDKKRPADRPRQRRKLAEKFAGLQKQNWKSFPLTFATPLRELQGRSFDGFANANIGCATAEISAHGFFNVFISRLRNALQQGHGAHDLPAL